MAPHPALTAVEALPPGKASLSELLAYHEAEVQRLRALQRAELVAVIAAVVGAGYVFSARELFQHRVVSPELAAAFTEAGITSVRKLGKKLRQLCSLSGTLERVGADEHGALWMCS